MGLNFRAAALATLRGSDGRVKGLGAGARVALSLAVQVSMGSQL